MKKNLIPRQMWAQMALVLVILVSIPLMILGPLLISTSQVAVKTSVLRDYEQLTVRAASEVSEFVQRPASLLNATAAIIGTIHADLWKQETVLVELALNDEIFGRIASLDLEGKELVTSEIGTPLKDRSQDLAFRVAQSGNSFMSDVYISPDHIPFVQMSVPIKQKGQIKR